MVTSQGLVGNVVFYQSGENNRMLLESLLIELLVNYFVLIFYLIFDIIFYYIILVSRYIYLSNY